MDKNKMSVPVAIVIAGIIIAGAIYLNNNKPSSNTADKTQNDSQTASIGVVKPVDSKDHILGNPNADVVIVEYSDTECPFCKNFQDSLEQIMSTYGNDGRVAWVYRNFPIAQLHPKAPKEAEALECVNELGGNDKFWEYTNLVFKTTNSNNSLDPAQLPEMAKSIGIDVDAFNTCLSSGKYTNFISQSVTDAQNTGAKGTPHTVIFTKNEITPAMKNSIINIFGQNATLLTFDSKNKKEFSMIGAVPLEILKGTIDILLK